MFVLLQAIQLHASLFLYAIMQEIACELHVNCMCTLDLIMSEKCCPLIKNLYSPIRLCVNYFSVYATEYQVFLRMLNIRLCWRSFIQCC